MKAHISGRSFILGFPGLFVTHEVKSFIKSHTPAGFIFFKDNLNDVQQIKTLLTDLKQLYQTLNLTPPILAIDYEGGLVDRLPDPCQRIPHANELGKTASTSELFKIGEQMGLTLKELGFTLNFSPVCDVSTPQTPDYLSSRIFSSDPETVATLIAAYIKGHQGTGVLACAKHFPGIGSATRDPHKKPIETTDPKQIFESTHWVPFKSAIEANVGTVMTSHIMCPNLDTQDIATYSQKITHTLLREHLEFKGLIISDDLNMGAIQEQLSESVSKTLVAGHDLVIISDRDINTHAKLLEDLC